MNYLFSNCLTFPIRFTVEENVSVIVYPLQSGSRIERVRLKTSNRSQIERVRNVFVSNHQTLVFIRQTRTKERAVYCTLDRTTFFVWSSKLSMVTVYTSQIGTNAVYGPRTLCEGLT